MYVQEKHLFSIFIQLAAMKTIYYSEYFLMKRENLMTIKDPVVLRLVKVTHLQVWNMAKHAFVATHYQIRIFFAQANVQHHAPVMQRRCVVAVGE